MSAGISVMYRMSGGCNVKKRCHDCKWLNAVARGEYVWKSGSTFKENNETYFECGKHPDKEGRKYWKETYTACKYFEEPDLKEVYVTEENGQLSFV